MMEIYEYLLKMLLDKWPDMKVEVKRTQISFKNRFMFACVSKGPGDAMRLTFGLPYRVDSPRIEHATEPYPMRWTHHVIIRNKSEIDGEIMEWLEEAYNFAENK